MPKIKQTTMKEFFMASAKRDGERLPSAAARDQHAR
jgi:hypothetical protein